MIYKHLFFTLPLLAAMTVASTTSCIRKQVGLTTVSVADSVRHYYPVVAGEKLNLSFLVKNTGDEILVINDIQPSCGCIVSNMEVKAIPPHDSIDMSFTYDSNKNVGYVKHCIRLFGNIKPKGMAVMQFDVNVVPPSDYDPDYEEIYHNEKVKEADAIGELVDGKSAQKGYFIDDETDKEQSKYPWRD